MTHQEKIDHMIADLEQRGVKKSFSAPPIYRALWTLGAHVPPPLFQSFASLALTMGVFFGVFWGTAMWWIQWRHLPVLALIAGVVGGALFGSIMAAMYRRKAQPLNLPSWNSYV